MSFREPDLQSGAATNSASHPYLKILLRKFLNMEEAVGFEPTEPYFMFNCFQNSSDRPLCQASNNNGGDEWIRTTVPFWGADLQSAAINHSATSPNLKILTL